MAECDLILGCQVPRIPLDWGDEPASATNTDETNTDETNTDER
ncbi:hypothetical protein CCYS_12365 [Corynebacterium cystitidis DSM 20524]|uniref:Uncharacterized protein n=1 Tax=Corynebacterium cystitidis DSM 20524 TaxID=1121357 RepID=A0A1H9V4K0_9CORY|nr:hypothetical protein CCYS_12365 [Corynebacterium cystitidis DSM 20524]SES16324.1 hypothetical protein SAMN05661109_02053 [Corynebacterium cystitidis DSM 20524]SNV62751.1 Uncharacterised protein [Corynebacterium cystitidis]